MTRYVDNFAELFKVMNEDIQDVMKNEVLDTVKDVMQDKIQTVVYDAHSPNNEDKPWKRRYTNGGLMDRDNIRIDESQSGITMNGFVMFVKNFAGGNPNASWTSYTDPPNYLAGIIENGRYTRGVGSNGLYTKNKDNTQWNYLRPRPFMYETFRELERTLKHLDAFKRGLKRKGYDTVDR